MTQPGQRRIRVRGRQRDDIDLDLLVQALLMIGEDRLQRQQSDDRPQPTDATDNGSPEATA